MKKIIDIVHYDQETLKKMGFETEHQINAVVAVADVLEQIRDLKEDFGFMTFLIKNADMLDHRPVEVISNIIDDGQKRDLFEEYFLKRLKMKAETKCKFQH